MSGALGQVVFAFFEDHLKIQKGLRPGSIRSYRDTIKLFLVHVAALCRRPVTRLALGDLAFERVLDFLRTIEEKRGNQPRTRNQRLAALRTFYRYLAVHHPEMLAEAQRVEAIPTKRVQAAKTVYLERDEIDALFQALPRDGDLALRDRTLLMFLYNTGARVQEAADLRNVDIDLDEPYRVRLHGKGDKWRCCPLWPETVTLLKRLPTVSSAEKTSPVFLSQQRKPLTRFGIYKIVKRHTATLGCSALGQEHHGLYPHAFSHPRRSTCSKRVLKSMLSGHGLATSASIPPTATLRSRCVRSRPQLPLACRPSILRWNAAPLPDGAKTQIS